MKIEHYLGESTHIENCHNCGREMLIFNSEQKEVRFCGWCKHPVGSYNETHLTVMQSRYTTRNAH